MPIIGAAVGVFYVYVIVIGHLSCSRGKERQGYGDFKLLAASALVGWQQLAVVILLSLCWCDCWESV